MQTALTQLEPRIKQALKDVYVAQRQALAGTLLECLRVKPPYVTFSWTALHMDKSAFSGLLEEVQRCGLDSNPNT